MPAYGGPAAVLERADIWPADHWYYYDDAKPTKVISCMKSCEHFRAGGGKVDVLFGCASVPVE